MLRPIDFKPIPLRGAFWFRPRLLCETNPRLVDFIGQSVQLALTTGCVAIWMQRRATFHPQDSIRHRRDFRKLLIRLDEISGTASRPGVASEGHQGGEVKARHLLLSVSYGK